MPDALSQISDPAQLRSMDAGELRQVADALRAYILTSVSKTGGHLSSNLGSVELTVALHAVFETPHDRLIWDVGHQTYAHKILTGRGDCMASLRQRGGLSGFPVRSESVYDAFGTAHASTSISAALGMAVAARSLGVKRQCVAVIGDGALSGGMAFEALNNAGVLEGVDLLVVLNDNDMSISPAVGALNRYLARLMSGRFYAQAKRVGKQMLRPVPPLLELAKRFEEHAKGMVAPSTLFEEFGFNYIGPIDGHDLNALLPTLKNIKRLGGLQFLHVVTRKGQGYARAEADPVLYHGPGKFDPDRGIEPASAPAKPSFTQVFGDWVCDMAQQDPRLIAITPAMREGSGLVRFAQTFPDRFFDCGIAEQHAVTFAAGAACDGLRPVVAIYSTFLQRAYDQLIHDVALQNLPVVFAVDRAGLVGADGATHQGAFDLSFLNCVPNMMLMAPADENECRQMLTTAFKHAGPSVVRYPRGAGAGVCVDAGLEGLPVGQAQLRRQSRGLGSPRIVILAFGPVLYAALAAADALDATVVNMRFVKPLDVATLELMAASHDAVVTIEENVVLGGAGSACAQALSQMGCHKPLLMLGLPDAFIDQAEQSSQLASAGLDAAGIERAIRQRFFNTRAHEAPALLRG